MNHTFGIGALVLVIAGLAGCMLPPSSYQSAFSLVAPDGTRTRIVTPKDGNVGSVNLDKTITVRTGTNETTTTTVHFSVSNLNYAVSDKATTTELAIIKQMMPDGIGGIVKDTGAAAGGVLGAAAKAAVKP